VESTTHTTHTTRPLAALLLAVGVILTLAAPALAGASSHEAVDASFFYDDGTHAVFAGPGFDVDAGCPSAADPEAHVVRPREDLLHQQGRRSTPVAVHRLADYGASDALTVLLAICFGGAPDQPIAVGEGTVWFNNHCAPGPEGCQSPGATWVATNGVFAEVRDVTTGEELQVRTLARLDVEWPLDGAPTETVRFMQVDIR
jgi:hypothetical protein